jgi:hypothetical protein
MKTLSVPERHQLRIAKQTLKMAPAMIGVMGGPSIEEARKIIERLAPRKRAVTSIWEAACTC